MHSTDVILHGVRCTNLLLVSYIPARVNRQDMVYPTSNTAVLKDDTQLAYRYTFAYSPYSALHVIFKEDGTVQVKYVDNDQFNDAIISNFTIHDTEEELFMKSTIQNDFGIGTKEIETFRLIWDEYFGTI
ncbi:hypothetical protein [Escherichia phage vB_EcoM_JNE01]|nr:hypothetical protein [Escherichia phage vB_EcoM_JNE01]